VIPGVDPLQRRRERRPRRLPPPDEDAACAVGQLRRPHHEVVEAVPVEVCDRERGAGPPRAFSGQQRPDVVEPMLAFESDHGGLGGVVIVVADAARERQQGDGRSEGEHPAGRWRHPLMMPDGAAGTSGTTT